MGLIMVLAVGCFAGWLAGFASKRSTSPRKSSLIATGIVGALLGGFVLGPILGGGNLLEQQLNPMSAVVAALGAIPLLVAAALFRRRRTAKSALLEFEAHREAR